MAQYLGYNFDPELFMLNWQQQEDLVKTALLDCGVMQDNATIRSLIANGGDFYTIPFYGVLDGTVQNYDGATDITANTVSGKAQSGIVFGRDAAWEETQFVRDYNSGADPMKQITSQTAKFWQKQRQSILIKILSGVLGITGNADWTKHTTSLAAASGSVGVDNLVGAATAAEAAQRAVGDNSDIFTMAVMHSAVALGLAKHEQLKFRTQTDANGMQRQLKIADWNGMTVVVDDGVPTKASSISGATEYTTYLLGRGAIQHADAPVSNPVETHREPFKAGGKNFLITRIRETIHPNGFSFTKPSGYAGSPTDAQLAAKANWSVAGDPKGIAIAQLITNG